MKIEAKNIFECIRPEGEAASASTRDSAALSPLSVLWAFGSAALEF